MMMQQTEFHKLLRFGFVGTIGLAVDMAFTWLCKEQLGLYPYLANAMGFSLAVVNNFFLNKYWTFRERSSLSVGQFAFFLAVSLFGLLLNTLLLKLVYGIWNFDFYLAKLLATSMVMAWNFLANRFMVFNRKTDNSAINCD